MERALILVMILVTMVAGAEEHHPWKGFSVTCLYGDDKANASCHGVRLVRKIVQSLLEEARRRKSLVIIDGVSLVESETGSSSSRSDKEGAMSTIIGFLENRELRIRLSNLMPSNWESAVEGSLPAGRGHKDKGDKKGDNGVMMMAVMMGKMLAAIGFGTLALMAMKALILSSLALMLSLITAMKKHHSGSHHEDHHLVYAQEVSPHYRRRRSNVNLAENYESHPYRKQIVIEKLR